MRLYVEELRTEPLVQVFTRQTTALVPKFRLHLCKYLSPVGTFILDLTDADDHVVASSSQTLADMQLAGSANLQANYYHGYVTFAFDRAYTLRPGTYKLKLSSSGYVYDPDEFLGWVKAVEDPAISLTGGGVPDTNVVAPYDFESYALERFR